MQPFLESIHFGTKFLIIMMCIIFLLQITALDSRIVSYLYFNPFQIIYKFQFWRLISSIFIHGGILHIVMNMLSFVSLGISLESTIGTLSFFYHIILFGILSGLIHTGIAFFMKLGGDNNQYISNSLGFSGVLYALMVVDIYLQPYESRSLFGLWLIPSFIYPWANLLIMQLLLPNVSLLGHVSGIFTGFMYQFGWLKFLTPKKSFFDKIEKKLCICCLNRSGYVKAGGITNFVYQPYAVFNQNHEEADEEDPDDAPHGLFTGRAHTLGEHNNNHNINNNEQNDNGDTNRANP